MSEQVQQVEVKKDRPVLKAGAFLAGTVLAITAGAVGMRMYDDINDNHVDPTVAELFTQANQDCANKKVKEFSLTPERIKQAPSLQALTDSANSDVRSAIAQCIFDETGISAGTKGFVQENPTIVLSINANAVAATEG